MTVLILGGEGQLGRELKRIIPNSIALNHSDGGIDLTSSSESIMGKILAIHPDVIINASAMTNVDQCEAEKKLALKINGVSLKYLTKVALTVEAYLVQISTDYVFDGEEGNYHETSPPNPINYYGLSKLIGDAYANSYDNTVIIRTSGVFGHSSNFPKYAFETLKNGKELNVLDGYYSPIHAVHLAGSISEILNLRPTGVLNIAGERISRFSLAQKMCEIFGFDQKLLHYSSHELKLMARRPYDSSLNIDKAKELISYPFNNIESGLKLLREP